MDTTNKGQDAGNLHGTIVRITVPTTGAGYTIPSGNLLPSEGMKCESVVRSRLRVLILLRFCGENFLVFFVAAFTHVEHSSSNNLKPL